MSNKKQAIEALLQSVTIRDQRNVNRIRQAFQNIPDDPIANVVSDIDQDLSTSADPSFNSIQLSSGTRVSNIDTSQSLGNSDNAIPTQNAVFTYVNSNIEGLKVKQSVRAATDGGNIDLSSASNPNPIDGVTLSDGDRVLLKDQSTGSENGIYDAVDATDPTTWVRSADFDEDEDVFGGAATFVNEGSNNGDTRWVVTIDNPITVGTTTITFAKFSGAGQVTGGVMINKSGDTLNLDIASGSAATSADGDLIPFADVSNSNAVQYDTVSDVLSNYDDQTATLTNKTVDANATGNSFSNFAHGSEVDNPTSGVHGVTGNVVGTSDSQTLSSKTIDNSNSLTIQDSNLTLQDNGDNTKQLNLELSGITTSTTRTLTVPDASITIVGESSTQTLSNKTLDNTTSATLQDNNLTLQDNSDTSKQANFELSGITTSTTRTLTLPDANITIVGEASTQTLTNKTIDANNNTVSNLAHGNEVDNPTSGVHGVSGNVVGTSDTQTLSSKTLDNSNSFTIQDNNLTLQDNSDNTKQLNLQLSGITTSTTRTLTVPDADDTIVGLSTTDTLSNKTFGNVVTYNTGANTNASVDEGGIDRSSSNAETYTIQNSGTGSMELQVSGTISLDGGTTSIGSTELNLLDGMTGKTGSDVNFVTGTSGSNGDVVKFNADGDAVAANFTESDVNQKTKAVLPFGANFDATGNFAKANGDAESADNSSSFVTKHPAVAGTINRVTFFHSGDLSSNNATIKIHVNGSSQASFTASGGADSVDVATGLGISVSNGDIVEVEFDAGSTNPSNSIVNVLVE